MLFYDNIKDLQENNYTFIVGGRIKNETKIFETIVKKNDFAIFSKNRKLKKWVKMIRFSIGMKDTENAAKKATYKTVWVAGPSIEHTKAILPVKDIIAKLVS